jgi:hypothetical protein
VEKHHVWLSDILLEADYAAGRLDVNGGLNVLRTMFPATGPAATPPESVDGVP